MRASRSTSSTVRGTPARLNVHAEGQWPTALTFEELADADDFEDEDAWFQEIDKLHGEYGLAGFDGLLLELRAPS